MSDMAKRLRERRAQVWEQMKGIADAAADENRSFSAEEQGQWDSQSEELDKLDTRIKSALDTEQRAKDADDAFERLGKSGGGEVRRGEVAVVGDKDLDTQFRSLGRGEISKVEVGLPSAMERRSILERRDLATSSDTVPVGFVRQLYRYLVDTNSIRQSNPRVITTGNGETLTLPKAVSYGDAVWLAEGASLTEADPGFDSVSLGAHKVGKIVSVNRELIDDAGFDLLGFLAQEAGERIGLATNNAYTSGTGTGKPTGLVGAATSVDGESGVDITSDALLDLVYAIAVPYRPRGSFQASDAALAAIRKIKDLNGQYLWQQSMQAGQPDRLLGYPVYSNPAMPSPEASATSVAFGDFGGYWIRDVTPLRFDRSDEFKFDSDVVTFRVLYRTDGALGDPNAVKVLKQSAT
ncbi:MAG: phage major capsid protein [Streptosporangiales bacterium]